MSFFHLIRFPNLLIIILTQCFVRFFLFEKFDAEPSLSLLDFSLLILATVLLAGAGNIINDIYDIETDKVNKPSKVLIGKKVSKKAALGFWIVFNLIAVFIGFYLSNQIERPVFSIIFILILALLYIYSRHLKGKILVGNILISFLTAMVFVIVGVFDLLPNFSFSENQNAFEVLLHFSIFAFLINLLREMVKDQEDINGDYKAGSKTLPIVLGSSRANKVIFAFALLPVMGIVYYTYNYLNYNKYAATFVMFLILLPLSYFLVKIYKAKTKNDYKQLSRLLKILMLIGILAIGLYPRL